MTANHTRTPLDVIELLDRRVKALEAARAAGAQYGLCTSTTHPANPTTGLQILETDTGLRAYWSGSAWIYPPQRIGQKLLTASAPSITLAVPTGPAFSTLRVAWSARSDYSGGSATYMYLQLNGDTTTTHYDWQINQGSGSVTSPGASPSAVGQIEVGTMAAATATSGYVGGGEITIANASGTTFKAVSAHSTSMESVSSGFSGTYGGDWLQSVPISSITLSPQFGNFVAGTAAYLYGET